MSTVFWLISTGWVFSSRVTLAWVRRETGLELVKRGHRLVADDRVDVYAKDEETLWGEPAEILRHLLEIRGVGIIDVMSLYGASAVRNSSQVQLGYLISDNFEDGKVFDRLGKWERRN